MSDSPKAPEPTEPLPKARVERRRWSVAVVWVVPIVAAIVAGYLVYSRFQEFGPAISIEFRDGNGVKAGQTEIRYRGVTIGDVKAIELSRDAEHVVVKARLHRTAASVAREGALFWIVRPQVGPAAVTGLSTVITGPYIQVAPGTGKSQSAFVGLENAPATLESKALRIILAAGHLASVRLGSPIYYRGIQVGSVTAADLSGDSTSAHVHAVISQRYARLVRVGSRFWDVSGLDVNVSLRRGLEINLESLRSLVAGGIAFATPEDPRLAPAKDGTIFVLHDKPEKEWLTWAPKISLPPASQ